MYGQFRSSHVGLDLSSAFQKSAVAPLDPVISTSKNGFNPQSVRQRRVTKPVVTFDQSQISYPEALRKGTIPFKLSLLLTGRFPFTYTRNQDDSFDYRYNLLSLQGVLFLLSCVTVLSCLFLCLVGFSMLVLEDSKGSEAARDELRQIWSTMISFLLVGNCLVNAAVGNVHLLKNGGKQLAAFLGHWSRAVGQMRMDVATDLRRYTYKQLLVIHGFAAVLVVLYVFGAKPIVHEGAEDLAILVFRTFIPQPHKHPHFQQLKLLGFTAFLLSIYSYMANILVFVFTSQVLRCGFKIWNQRFQSLAAQAHENLREDRSSTAELYKDHSHLLQLIEEANEFFAPIMQTYYGSQILNICLEVYFVVTYGGDDARDVAVGLTIMLQTCFIFYMVSIAASTMHEEAHAGFDILRKYNVLRARNEDERIFLRSMATSYSGPLICLTGGKYFNIHRPFILTVLGAVLTYFIIILQFRTA